MGPPTLWMRFRQMMGRAFRETGQALDRVGVRGEQHAVTTRRIGDNPYKFDDHFSRHRQQFPLIWRGQPIVHPDVAYLAPCCTMIGSVRIGAGSSVWYGAILRGDMCENGSSFADGNQYNETSTQVFELDPHRRETSRFSNKDVGGGIFIGDNTNVQDGSIITANVDHTRIGNGVTIGHLAHIHSATVHDFSLVGMGSVLQEGVLVESEAFIAAGAVVAPNTTVRSGELWVGQPARKIRDLTKAEREKLHYQSNEYVKVARGQSGIMELGGNLPESLIQYTMLGSSALSEDDTATATEEGGGLSEKKDS